MTPRTLHLRVLGLALASALLTLSGCQNAPVRTSEADYQTNLDHTISATTLRTLTIHCGAGSIEVIGEESRRDIAIEGMVSTHADSFGEAKRIANEVKLQVQAEGTENPIVRISEPMIASANQSYAYDMVVRVPHTVQVTVKDTTGDVMIGGLSGGLELSSASGDVAVEQVHGGLVIDSNGLNTKIQDVSGHLQVKDGRGRLEISHVSGDIDIEDGGGALVVQFVTGNVTAKDNPEGANMKNIDGDVTLIRISPASSKIQGVTGVLSYPTGSR